MTNKGVGVVTSVGGSEGIYHDMAHAPEWNFEPMKFGLILDKQSLLI